jgi:glutamate-1-semialdehyde 2,1-aminomutase
MRNRYRERTPASRTLVDRGRRTMPLGVESNFRFFDPYPLFIDRAAGARVWDADGREYLDFALCFGALMTGHAHPAIVRAVSEQAARGLLYGMPHAPMLDLAELLTQQHHVDRVRFANSGTEATMHAIRLARGYTGRDKIVKFEGAYHGAHDAALVSVKPKQGMGGLVDSPDSVPASLGIPGAITALTLVATFNDCESVETAFARHAGEIAALIVEPVMMNIGVCEPEPGFLQALRAIATREGALLIFDEVKTGTKLAAGGAAEFYGVAPDLIAIAKSFGGGGSIAAFGGRAEVMAAIERFEVFHAGTYNAAPLAVAAALAALREVLTPEACARAQSLNRRLIEGYTRIIDAAGLPAHATGVGVNGCIYFCRERVRNYRDFLRVDANAFWRYYFGMLDRGVIPGGQYYDEQWTISVAHTEADIDAHLTAFEAVAREMTKDNTLHHGGH